LGLELSSAQCPFLEDITSENVHFLERPGKFALKSNSFSSLTKKQKRSIRYIFEKLKRSDLLEEGEKPLP